MPTETTTAPNTGKQLLALSLVVVCLSMLLRLLGLAEYPLMDTTEARYAEIGRLMLVSGDWITPQVTPGTPFWGKPPLSAWLTAGSMAIFGVNEFAARFPAWLLGIGSLLCLWPMISRSRNSQQAALSLAICAGLPLWLYNAGAVMTDPALVFATTLSMTGFWMAMYPVQQQRRWGWLFFAGLGLGLLAKGPVALVLTGTACGLWALSQRRVLEVLQVLPWVSGIALMLAIAAPWYIAAELKTPGFIEYFLVGEHFLRFVQPGWSGDLYGTAHVRPYGTIWWFAVLAALPWTALALGRAAYLWYRRHNSAAHSTIRLPGWIAYLLCWTLAPLLFFSFAGNILPAYVLPGLAAFAILCAELVGNSRGVKWWLLPCLVAPVGLSVAIVLIATGQLSVKSSKVTVEYWLQQASAEDTLAVVGGLPHSTRLYSHGRAIDIDAQLATLATAPAWVLVHDKAHEKLLKQLPECNRPAIVRSKHYQLLNCQPESFGRAG